MKVLTCKIIFPKTQSRAKELALYKINAVEVIRSWKELTTRATIVLPRNVGDFDKMKVREVFRHGDPIKVFLGYDSDNKMFFEGFITGVSADIPITITCEDLMWKLKRVKVNYANNNVTLEKMLKDICPGYKIDALEGVQLGSVRFAKTTVAQVLDKLKSDFNLSTWFNGNVLTCGKYYATGNRTVIYNLEKNVVDNSLVYKNKEDIVLKITGTSLLPNGEKLEAEIGDDGGDTMQLSYYNVKPKSELEKKIKHDYDNAHRDAYDGSLTGYGEPLPQVGGKALLKSTLYPDRQGTYYVDAVNTTFNDGGFRNDVELGGVVIPEDDKS